MAVRVAELAKIFAGYPTSCRIREDGARFCWGDERGGIMKIPEG